MAAHDDVQVTALGTCTVRAHDRVDVSSTSRGMVATHDRAVARVWDHAVAVSFGAYTPRQDSSPSRAFHLPDLDPELREAALTLARLQFPGTSADLKAAVTALHG